MLAGASLVENLACTTEQAQANSSSGAGGTGSGGTGSGGTTTSGMGGQTASTATSGQGTGGGQGGSGPMVCTPSDDNILGPYYRPNAPFRDDLAAPGAQGVRVQVSGRVLDTNCQPLANAIVDLWQADHSGDYDNDGVNDPPDNAFILRGRLNTDADGKYSFRSIIPGHYLNGNQYRPAHIHVRVSAQGQKMLTTQLYFEGDPYNDIDGFIKPSLIMPLTDVGNEKHAVFDFVLATA